MLVSEKRLAANRSNSLHSTGPKTEQGKAASSRNSLKHGLTGAGIVLNEGDQAEVEKRVVLLHEDLDPQSVLGSMHLRKVAINSVKSERAAALENAEVARRVRVAVNDYNEQRARLVDELIADLPNDPRAVVRNLRRMPEGVDRMLEAWRVLRRRLEIGGVILWSTDQLYQATNLVGYRAGHSDDTRFGELSSAMGGNFYALTPSEGGGLDLEARKEWARAAMLTLIDEKIAELEAHRTTLDFDRIEQDRREAPARATLDDSPEGKLNRRYEAEADRNFYKALKEYRQAEAESRARVEARPEPETPAPVESRMGSFRETTPPADPIEPSAFLDDPALEKPPVATPKRGRSGRDEPQSPPG